MEERIDPVLFQLSYDYVGDLAETVSLVWPNDMRANRSPPLEEIVKRLLQNATKRGRPPPFRKLDERARHNRTLGADQTGDRRP